MASLDHGSLCRRAGRWLRHHHRCQVVAVEPRSLRTREQPDALGWRGDGWSVLVEVKTSRADFFADAQKPFRGPAAKVTGMGQERWFLTPGGLLKPGELPEGWGLAEVRGRVIRVTVPAPRSARFDVARFRWEVCLLLSIVQGERKARGADMNLLEDTPGLPGLLAAELLAHVGASFTDASGPEDAPTDTPEECSR